MKHKDLDTIDYQILELLQKNGRMPVKEIAHQINLSAPATSNRIDYLERENYILGYQAVVDPVKMGLYTKAFICLEVSPKHKKQFYPYIEKCANVVECSCVTGEYSMLLEVQFRTTIELDIFIGELQRFGRTNTLIAFSTAVGHRGVSLSHVLETKES